MGERHPRAVGFSGLVVVVWAGLVVVWVLGMGRVRRPGGGPEPEPAG